MKLKTAVRLYWSLMLSGEALILLGLYLDQNFPMMMFGCVPPLIAVLVVDNFFNCPKCGTYLYNRYGLPQKCPHCGVNIKKAMEEE